MSPFLRRVFYTPAFTGALLLRLALPSTAQGQQADSLAGISGKLAQYHRQAPTEKLFVHLDQPTHAAGETIWLKVYAVDGTRHRPLALSRVAYVEVLNASQKPVAQVSITLEQGSGHGTIELPAQLASGHYTVRAYTSWMQNFGPEFYFQAPLVVLNTFSASGAGIAKEAPAYDVQFFPEGGQLVQGLASRVGFKIIDNAGRGVAATGTVADASGRRVATFSTLKHGMGSFLLGPAQAGAAYTATLQLASGGCLTARLPSVQPRGYVLSLGEENATTLRLTVQTANPELAAGPVQLLGHVGQQVSIAAKAGFVAGRATFFVKKDALPAGISHFTVFNALRQPVAERLYFTPLRHRLALTVAATKSTYLPREKVQLQVAAPTATNASLAVYRLDSLSAPNSTDIASWLGLAADLKGTVEDPGYYLRDSSAVGREAADNLMLTQGWSRFRWQEVLAGQPLSLPHLPEVYGPVLQAQLLTAAGAPAPAGIGAYLTVPSRSGRFYYAVTQPGGLAQFEPENFVGTQKVVLQTDPRRDSTYRVELRNPYSTRYALSHPAPPLVLTKSLSAALTERHVQVQVAQAFAEPRQSVFQGAPQDSASFFGKPDERYLLDEYTRFKEMEDVMREYVPGVRVRKRRDGFHFVVFDRPGQTYFQNDPLVLLDGLPVFDTNKLMAFDPLKVKRLDVLTGRYFQGPLVYDGVVSYTTYQGDLGGFSINPHALVEEYEGMQGQREFYAPRYEASSQSRLPDLRNLLYWNPEVRLQPTLGQTVDFFTSDQAGRYLVVVQGLGSNGQLGSTSLLLDVKPTL
jgi:hypothetical protein